MTFSTFISLRYLRSKKRSWFLSFLSFLSLAGIAISVSGFFVIHAVMNGFSSHLRDALIGFNAPVTVPLAQDFNREKELTRFLEGKRNVTGWERVSEFDVLATTPQGVTSGIRVRGVSVEKKKEDPRLSVYFFTDSDWDDLAVKNEGGAGILVGEEAYTRLHFIPGEPEIITLIDPFGDVSPIGEVLPRKMNFRVIGFFSTHFYDFDARYVLIGEEEAVRLSGGKKGKSRFLIQLGHPERGGSFAADLKQEFPELSPSTWMEQNKRLFSALRLEKIGMFLLIVLITFIACFNIIGLVSLLTLAKRREVALYSALGLDRDALWKIFGRLGFFLGLTGTLIGLALGGLAVFWLARSPLPLPPAYYLEVLPVKVDWVVSLLFSLMVPGMASLASLWPAMQISRMKPAEILRST